MADSQEKKTSDSPTETLDLGSLSSLDFGPSWADGSSPAKTPREPRPERGRRPADGPRRSGRDGGGDRRSGPGARGDRRPPRQSHRGEGGERGGPHERGHRGHHPRGEPRHQEFKPTVKVDLYPQDEAFDALVGRLRASARTYQLFEIAHLILEKPERFVVVVSNFPAGGGAAPSPLFFAVPGHLPFSSEEEAVGHVMEHHLDLFFDTEEIEVEPPKGNFQMVNRCSVTGELLGPPNYHRYQEFLQRHYASRIHGMSFERFTSKVESVKEQESIDAWIEKMKKGSRYTLKDRAEGEPESLESMEAVRHFLLRHRRDQILGSGETVRFAGRDIERLPQGDLRRSVEHHIERQQHFPLETANNLRGRLRRHKFTVYKKGSKGVSFVCAVKRKFRDGSTVFTDSIRNLIEFIEKNPMIPAARVSMDYLGIDAESRKPERLKVTDAEIAAAKDARVADAGTQDSEQAGDGSSDVAGPVAGSEAPAESRGEAAAGEPASPEVQEASTASGDEEQAALRALMLDLRWLVTEGYVTEYGDGRLFAPPAMPEPRKDREEPGATEEAKIEAEAPAGAEAEPVAAPENGGSEPTAASAAEQPVVEESEPVEAAIPEAESKPSGAEEEAVEGISSEGEAAEKA